MTAEKIGDAFGYDQEKKDALAVRLADKTHAYVPIERRVQPEKAAEIMGELEAEVKYLEEDQTAR